MKTNNEIIDSEVIEHFDKLLQQRVFRLGRILLVFLIVLNIGILFSIIQLYFKFDATNAKSQSTSTPLGSNPPQNGLTSTVSSENDTLLPSPSLENEPQITLPSKHFVRFKAGKTELDILSQKELVEISQIFQQEPNITMSIEGHTDDEGSDRNNLLLSVNRSKIVKNYLLNLGVDEKLMKIVGHGSYYPIADNKTAEGREKNRRVEIIIKSR